MRVAPVGIEYIHQTWPLVEKYIQSAFDEGASGEMLYTMDNVRAYLASGEWQLLVAVDENNLIKGAATIAYTNHPLQRVAFVTAIGGRLIANKILFEQFKLIMKQNGATILQAHGKASIVRLWRRLNFTAHNTLVELKL